MDINIAIIDQNEIFRESLKIALEQIDGFSVTLDSDNCKCIENLSKNSIQVLLIDNNIRNEKCIELIREAQSKSITVLILTMFKEELNPGFGRVDTMLKNSSKMDFEYRIRKLTGS